MIMAAPSKEKTVEIDILGLLRESSLAAHFAIRGRLESRVIPRGE